MEVALLLLAPLLLLAVAFVLGKGLYHFMQEGHEARLRSNRMMQWRVALQFFAVLALLALMALFAG